MSDEQEKQAERRDDAWLADRVRLLREVHFADMAQGYPILTRFGTRARYRFGSISARNGKTIISINRLFADPFVPVYVVDATLAHELAHYAHGFGSGLPRIYRDAHRGGVVDSELEKRGLGEVSARADQWRAAHWDAFYATRCSDLVTQHSNRHADLQTQWSVFLAHPERRTREDLHTRSTQTAARLGLAFTKPMTIEWLHATTRQTAPSYWFAQIGTLRIHGLLADRRVPDTVLNFELAYWLTRLALGGKWEVIRAQLCRRGMAQTLEEALEWRKRRWTTFQQRHHPLRQK